MTTQTENDDGDVIRTWALQTIINEHDFSSFEAYLVVEDEVENFAPLGLKLNTIGHRAHWKYDCKGAQNSPKLF
ncbi:hypothetical protein [Candidatus Puniceispirillum sp.]|uniref:hypothetical protein n=1 Tax=Candidatus Puniceispirillum sp. TaxID=2026719 RepID=UPI003F69B810